MMGRDGFQRCPCDATWSYQIHPLPWCHVININSSIIIQRAMDAPTVNPSPARARASPVTSRAVRAVQDGRTPSPARGSRFSTPPKAVSKPTTATASPCRKRESRATNAAPQKSQPKAAWIRAAIDLQQQPPPDGPATRSALSSRGRGGDLTTKHDGHADARRVTRASPSSSAAKPTTTIKQPAINPGTTTIVVNEPIL